MLAYRPSVCLSVCPSHGWISQKQLQLSPQSSPMTLVSLWLTSPRNSKGYIWSGALNNRGVGIIRNIQPISSPIYQGCHVLTFALARLSWSLGTSGTVVIMVIIVDVFSRRISWSMRGSSCSSDYRRISWSHKMTSLLSYPIIAGELKQSRNSIHHGTRHNSCHKYSFVIAIIFKPILSI